MRLSISLIGFLFCLFASGESAATVKTVPKGFVTTRGTEFELDGSSFAFVGANSYVSLNSSITCWVYLNVGSGCRF